MLLEMKEFETKVTVDNVLTVATYFHANFEAIHPFTSGNGRTGRTLLNYYLLIHNHPPLIVYEEDKRLYYDSLQKYDEIGEIASLKEFFKCQTEKTWEKQLQRSNGERQKRTGNLVDILSKDE